MAKYGIETFKDGKNTRFTIDQEEVYGKLYATRVETAYVFEYIDENGESHSEDEQTKHQLLSRTQNFVPWTPNNTGEIGSKSLIAYSEKRGEYMDIKLPIDFDGDSLGYEEEVVLKGLNVLVNTTGSGRNKQYVFYASTEAVEKVGQAPKQEAAKPKEQVAQQTENKK
ncbi:hypothetical protein [Pseudolactococcus insecticola]|uniref:DUF961 domain-containing protein n=1 Tax=Pseudolactococcus insecticola TaxID=2709158 RepID=A0A6A0B5X0_9LACT|nr:hypothetical protein [Lactococcus insecticola]GFH40829.1 hypothetical protein Hs20B_12270 [Lactococcus insecticola]